MNKIESKAYKNLEYNEQVVVWRDNNTGTTVYIAKVIGGLLYTTVCLGENSRGGVARQSPSAHSVFVSVDND